MRTKNKKWIVPILAIVPLLALAALLASGVFTPNNAEALDGEADCGFDVTSTSTVNAISASIDDDASGTIEDDEDDDVCYVLTDSVDIIVENNGDNDAQFIALVTGGNDFPKVQAVLDDAAALSTVDDPATDDDFAKGVDLHHIAELARPGPVSTTQETITINSSMAKNGNVFVFAYVAAEDARIDNFPIGNATTVPAASDARLRIVFLDSPSLTQPDRVADDGENRLRGQDRPGLHLRCYDSHQRGHCRGGRGWNVHPRRR